MPEDVNPCDRAKHKPYQQLATVIHRRFHLRFESVAVSARSESYFFRLIEFLNVVLSGWFQLQLSVRVYETEESFHGRQGTLSAGGLFFSFWFWSMAWSFLVFRRRK